MNSHRILLPVFLLVVIGLIVSAITPATAATAAKTPPPPDPRKLIKTVSVKDSTVVIQYMRDKTLHTYTIDDRTVLNINNNSGKLADIKPGMQVDDFLERDDHELDSLTLSGYGDQPAAPKTPAKKPETKPKTPAATPATTPPAQT